MVTNVKYEAPVITLTFLLGSLQFLRVFPAKSFMTTTCK